MGEVKMYSIKTLQEIKWERKQRRQKRLYRAMSAMWIFILIFLFLFA